MESDLVKTKRVLHVKIRAASPDMARLAVAMMKNTFPLVEAFGDAHVRLLKNIDEPSVFLQVIEYETDEAFELNRHKLASDPTLQAWRALFSGLIAIDVYEDVTGSG